MGLPEVPEIPDVIPISWDSDVCGLSISIAPTDDLGFLMARRGVKLRTPTDRKDYKPFAAGAGKLVERTVLEILEQNK